MTEATAKKQKEKQAQEAKAKKQASNARQRQRRQRLQTTNELTATKVRTSLVVEDQSSRHAENLPTLEVLLKYKTSFMHKFLAERSERIMQVTERLASALRALSVERDAYEQLSSWISVTINEARAEINEIATQRKIMEKTLSKEQRKVNVNTPDKYQVKFEFTTPIGAQVISLVKDVDQELAEAQRIYFAGAMNDLELTEANKQGFKIINAFIEKVFKVTSPGRREGGRFEAAQFAKSMKEGALATSEEPKAAAGE
jgi:hypothetical protein